MNEKEVPEQMTKPKYHKNVLNQVVFNYWGPSLSQF